MKSALYSFVIFVNLPAFGQEPPTQEFAVASLRLASPRDLRDERPYADGRRTGGPGTPDPGRVTYSRVPLDRILAEAFDVPRGQIRGPDFIRKERYDIVANVPAGASPEQAQTMLRNLLVERLHLAAHLQREIVPGYDLRRTDADFTLKETAKDPDAFVQEPQPGGDVTRGEDGFPQLAAGVRWGVIMVPGHTRSHFNATTMTEFSRFLGGRLGLPAGGAAYGRTWVEPAAIVDKTGEAGHYDFTFDYAAFALSVPALFDENLSEIQKALSKQLGLKLVEAKVPVDTLVIDHLEKTPIGN